MENLNVGDRVKIADDSPLARRVLKESNAGYGGYKCELFGNVGVIDSERDDDCGHRFRVVIGPFNIAWWWPSVLLEKLPAEDCENIHKAMEYLSNCLPKKCRCAVQIRSDPSPSTPGVAEIVFDHVVRDGKCMLQIAEIRGILSPNELPEEYFNGSPRMDLILNGLWVTDEELAWRHFVGQILTEEEASKLIKRMRACGKRLHDINVAARAKADEERLARWQVKGQKVVRI